MFKSSLALPHRDSHSQLDRAALRQVRNTLCSRVRQVQAEGDQDFARDFPGMVEAVEAGLRHEEGLLEALGHAQLHARRAENAIILSALHRVAAQVEQGSVELARQVAVALGDVLSFHGPLPEQQIAVPARCH